MSDFKDFLKFVGIPVLLVFTFIGGLLTIYCYYDSKEMHDCISHYGYEYVNGECQKAR